MALKGSLREFGLADILQLLYYQRKTGVLLLESRLDRVRLLLHEGKIVSAESQKRSEENRLGRILLKKGLVTEDDIRQTMGEQKSSGARLGHLLLKKNLIGIEAIQEILINQITETAMQLLSWKEGRYEFKPQGVPLDKEIPIAIDTEHLLMEGVRLVDEWTTIEGRIQLDSVFEKTGKADTELTADEQTILGFVDGKSDVSTIADASGIDNFEVSKTLLSLAEKGLITLKQAVAAAPARPVPAKKAPSFAGISIILTAMVLIALTVSLAAPYILKADGISTTLMPPADNVKNLKASARIDSLRQEIEIYMYEKGSYPASLEQITGEKDPWGEPFIYSTSGDDFILFSAGTDKRADTKDDIY